MAKGDAETEAVPRVGTVSAGGVGVGDDRVTLGILSRIPWPKLLTRFREGGTAVATLRYKI